MNIGNLKKVTLLLNAKGETHFDNASSAQKFTFIYGAGSRGLSPFEIELGGKAVGEKGEMVVLQQEMAHFFGNHYQPILHILGMQIVPQRLHLEFAVNQVSEPEGREIVKAMAGAIGGGCGSDCDCGCH